MGSIIKNIKNWIIDYSSLIIGCLILVLMIKGCNGCTIERRYEYNSIKYENNIDSLKLVIINKENVINDLKDSINTLYLENIVLKDVIGDLKKDKEHYRITNKNLITVTEKLSNKDTIK